MNPKVKRDSYPALYLLNVVSMIKTLIPFARVGDGQKVALGLGRWVPTTGRLPSRGAAEGGSQSLQGRSQPRYLCILSLSLGPLFPSKSRCCTLATLPALAARWILPRSLSRRRYPGPGSPLPLGPPSTRGLEFHKPKKLLFIAEPMGSGDASSVPLRSCVQAMERETVLQDFPRQPRRLIASDCFRSDYSSPAKPSQAKPRREASMRTRNSLTACACAQKRNSHHFPPPQKKPI